MKRLDFEDKSRNITQTYANMLGVMNESFVADIINEQDISNSFYYVKVTELSNIWSLQERSLWEILTEVFISLHSLGVIFSTVFSSDGDKISVYFGGQLQHLETIKNTFSAVLPQLKYAKIDSVNDALYSANQVLNSTEWTNGGFLKGNPTGNKNFDFVNQFEKVVRGMKGEKWEISIFASPILKKESVLRQHIWLTRATDCSQLSEISYTDNDNLESVTYHKKYLHSEQYSKKIEAFVEKLNESIAVGEWGVTVNFATTSMSSTRLLGGLLSAAYHGEESIPEPVHPIYHKSGFNRLVRALGYTHTSFCDSPYPKYGNFYSSKELAVLSTPPVVDSAGLTVTDYVAFDVNQESMGDLNLGRILDNGDVTNNPYSINRNSLNRHGLVIGLTGSGKTNTIKSLICSLGKSQIGNTPFMIIEPAKKEYWELYKLGFDNLKIYSIGSNEVNAHRLCMNPFERMVYKASDGTKKSVSLQTHIDFVYAAFKASFIMYTPMPYVLEKAIYSIYEDYGWDIDNNTNVSGKEAYPTIEDLYFKIPQVVDDMGYDAKMRNDLIGSLQARINSLRLGSKGSALNVAKSFPIEHLLEGNTIIEIEDIGDDDVKAFIISLLLIMVSEYRRQQDDCQLSLRHLLFIEEAHRLLKNVQSGSGESADPRGAAVEFFCNMLAEMRSKGQGFVIADQIPSKLAPDLIKNTNLKIVHRTVSAEERELMGGAMNMTEEQIGALSTFKQGVAAVYSEGDNHPKLVKPNYAGVYMIDDRKSLSREAVLGAVASNCIDVTLNSAYAVLTNSRNAVCRACRANCSHKPVEVLERLTNYDSFVSFSKELNPLIINTCKVSNIRNSLIDFVNQDNFIGRLDDISAENCLLCCLLEDWCLNEKNAKLKDRIVSSYINEYLSK